MARRQATGRRDVRARRAQLTRESAALPALVEELKLHQVGLQVQNEQLRGTCAQLVESQARYADLYNLAPDCYLSLDSKGRILQLNLTGARFFGREKEFLVGKPFAVVARLRGTQSFFAQLRDCFQERRGGVIEMTVTARGGVRTVVQMVSTPMLGVEGVECLCALVDITARKLAEEEVRAARAELVETQQRALVVSDVSGLLSQSQPEEITLSAVARVVRGIADGCVVESVASDGAGRRALAVAFADPKNERRALKVLDRGSFGRLIRDGGAAHHEGVSDEVLARVGGDLPLLRSLRIHSLAVAPIVASGLTIGSVALLASHSGRRLIRADVELAEELGRRVGLALERVRLHTKLQAALTSRDQIVALVSHDLKNTLAAIALHARALPSSSTEQASASEIIRRCARYANRLLDDLVDLADIEAGRLSLRMAVENVTELLEETRMIFEPEAARKRIRLAVQSEHKAGAIMCDRNRIAQVLGNLVHNAIKFTPEGGSIVLNASGQRAEAVFAVRDTGRGVAREDHGRVFERSWRRQGAPGAGAGLGLFIARSLVEAHGGRIWLASKPDRGSTFFFSCPRWR